MQRWMYRWDMLSTFLVCLTFVTSAAPANESFINEWLNKPILAPNLPQQEVEKYCEAGVVRMPQLQGREEWERYAHRLREEMLSKVVLRGAAAQWRELPLRVEWLDTIDGGEGYRIKKLRYEPVPGLWIPALLYEPTKLDGKVPVTLNVNGHDGKGKAAEYKQIRCINLAKRGMLALNVEWLGMGQLRGDGFAHSRMNQLDLCGTSGLAPFYLSMKCGLDVLLSHPNADPTRVAVSGLSGGGWQTIYISSLDTRVTLANPVAGYSSFITRVHNHSDLGDSEQTPTDMAMVADYAHLTALLAPRPALLTYNIKDDCCFASAHALPPLLAAASPVYQLFGKETHLRSHVNEVPGTHNFERDNREAFYRMIVEHFLPESSAMEIESQGEVKTAEQLTVDLPAANGNFHTLAEQLARSLPLDFNVPIDPQQAEGQRDRQRERLRSLARIKDYEVVAEQVDRGEADGVVATSWRLKVGESWTVPAVEFAATEGKSTALVIADTGRAGLKESIAELLKSGKRVVAIDPFYIGESKLKERPYLWALLIASVGDRTLGLQASQLAATSRWLKTRYPEQPVQLIAHGERLSLSALTAAAIETQAVDGVELHGCLASLKDVIAKNYAVDQKPELFCFGLLEHFEIDRLVTLVAPREVQRK